MSVSGKYLTATVNGNEQESLHSWSADDSGTDQLDATSNSTGGFTSTDTGCFDLMVELGLWFDIGVSNHLAIQTGTILTDVRLFRAFDDATPAYEIPEAIVVGKPQRVEVRGRIEVTCRIKNRGAWTEDGS